MRIAFYTRYSARAASARQRFFALIPGLQAAGFDTETHALLADNYLQAMDAGGKIFLGPFLGGCLRRARDLCRRPRPDLAVVQYELWPYLPAFLERLAELSHPRYVVDFDDAWYLTYRRNFILRGKLEKVMARATAVTVGNSYLAEYARRRCARVEIFPTTVDAGVYKPREAAPARDEVVIGWMGSPTTAQCLRFIEPALAALARERKVRIRCVGASADFDLPGLPIEKQAWSQEQEVAEIRRFDIGINPLPDNEFTRGKCGYKLIQYMACAVPVVASPVGANCEIVETGQNGYLASSLDEWVNALRRLADDPDLRQQFGQAGRKKFEEKYSLQAVLPRIISFYREIVKGTA